MLARSGDPLREAPRTGRRTVSEVDTADVLESLTPIRDAQEPK